MNERTQPTTEYDLIARHPDAPQFSGYNDGRALFVNEDDEERVKRRIAEIQARLVLMKMFQNEGRDVSEDALFFAFSTYDCQTQMAEIQEFMDTYVLATYFMFPRRERTWFAVGETVKDNISILCDSHNEEQAWFDTVDLAVKKIHEELHIISY